MIMRTCIPLFIVAALAGIGNLEAAENWFQSSIPPGRCCAGITFTDQPTLDGTLMFGGFFTLSGEIYNDTWIARKGGWFQLKPEATPSPRFGPGMAYDVATGTVVLFGGSPPSGRDYNDTWIWDGSNWTLVIANGTRGSPPGRRSDTELMAYDARTGTIVMFGGYSQVSNTVLDDTWTWNGTTKTWTQQHPANHPSARRAPIAYDGATGTVVLFGGDNPRAGLTYGDTWVWDGTNWHQVLPVSAPRARAMASLAYDATRRQLVLFGGVNFAGVNSVTFNDTWTWNGTAWHQISTTTLPCGRYAAPMAYDPIARGEVLFGGAASENCGVYQDDTWVLAVQP